MVAFRMYAHLLAQYISNFRIFSQIQAFVSIDLDDQPGSQPQFFFRR